MEGLLFGGASVIVGSKFTIFALFYFVFEDSFPSTSPRGLIFLEGLIHGRAYFGILRYWKHTYFPLVLVLVVYRNK